MFQLTTDNQRPHMEIIQTTEICVLELENVWYFEKVERLQQDTHERRIQKVLKQYSYCRRKKIREIKSDKNLKLYPFDKGSEFVIMKKEETIKRIVEQFRKSDTIDYDPTTILLDKFQRELAKLKKEGKFDN